MEEKTAPSDLPVGQIYSASGRSFRAFCPACFRESGAPLSLHDKQGFCLDCDKREKQQLSAVG